MLSQDANMFIRIAAIITPVVLIILVVLSGVAIWAAKATLSTEQVATNFRMNVVAHELAELALRYCEDGVMKNDAILIILPLPLDAASGAGLHSAREAR